MQDNEIEVLADKLWSLDENRAEKSQLQLNYQSKTTFNDHTDKAGKMYVLFISFVFLCTNLSQKV